MLSLYQHTIPYTRIYVYSAYISLQQIQVSIKANRRIETILETTPKSMQALTAVHMKIVKNSTQSESKEKQFKRGVECAVKILSLFRHYKALASTPTSMLDLARILTVVAFFLIDRNCSCVLEFCLFFSFMWV